MILSSSETGLTRAVEHKNFPLDESPREGSSQLTFAFLGVAAAPKLLTDAHFSATANTTRLTPIQRLTYRVLVGLQSIEEFGIFAFFSPSRYPF